MLKHIPNHTKQLDVPKALLMVCKKSQSQGKPQIDYLMLEKEIEQLRNTQAKTIEQIVEFVDVHLEDFINITHHFRLLSEKISNTQITLQHLNSSLQHYRSSFYGVEGKIQSIINSYQKSLLEKQVMKKCRTQIQFLVRFNSEFEGIMQKNVQQLNQKERHIITRFCKKYHELIRVIGHQMVKEAVTDHKSLFELLVNLENQLEFYLSEQLTRTISQVQILPEHFEIWFIYLQKKDHFYQIIEDYLVGRELNNAEKLLLSNKVNVLSGKDQNLLNTFFQNIFTLIQALPQGYPNQRILSLVWRFLQKKQLSFLYTYMMPVFPLSYLCYMRNVQRLSSSLREELETNHNWNLKRWADFRAKNILDRSEKQQDLIKWIDITFKKNCMLEGVKTNMLRVAIQLLIKHCEKVVAAEYSIEHLNKIVEEMINTPIIFKAHLEQNFVSQDNNKILVYVEGQLYNAIRQYLRNHLSGLIKSCLSSLQPCKTFIMKVLSRKQQPPINKLQLILKPLNGYLKSNPILSKGASKVIDEVVRGQFKIYFQSSYLTEIRSYALNNVTNEQVKLLNQFIEKEKECVLQNDE